MTSSEGGMPGTIKPLAEGELLPCPFCGGKAYVRQGKMTQGCQLHGDRHQTYVIECKHKDAKYLPETNEKLPECIIKPTITMLSKEKAIAAWNRRD